MKTTMKATLALLAFGALALVASAQDNGGPPAKGHRPPPLPLVTALDTDHDGGISADEIAQAGTSLLTLDKNSDGKLTTDEYLPALPAKAPKDGWRPPQPPLVKALDANGDGTIDANEIANAPAALKALDTNSDGKLTQDELRPAMQRGGPPSGDQAAPPDDAPPGPPPGE
jgi:Ca2+-binding EF-hand superfamily protein